MPSNVGQPSFQGYYELSDDGAWVPSVEPEIRHLLGGKRGLLLRDFAYVGADHLMSIAKSGLDLDGGSKPKLTWILVGHPWNEYLASYVIHDSDCTDILDLLSKGLITPRQARRLRKQSDDRFKEGMLWLKREKLGWANNRLRRLEVRVKYKVVRLHAWWTLMLWGGSIEQKIADSEDSADNSETAGTEK